MNISTFNNATQVSTFIILQVFSSLSNRFQILLLNSNNTYKLSSANISVQKLLHANNLIKNFKSKKY